MSNKFDQLAKTVAQSVTRRQALKRFGLGLATIALAGFGFKALGEAGGCLASGTPCFPFPFNKGSSDGKDHTCDKCCSGSFVGTGGTGDGAVCA